VEDIRLLLAQRRLRKRAGMGDYLVKIELRNEERCKHVLSMQKKEAPNL